MFICLCCISALKLILKWPSTKTSSLITKSTFKKKKNYGPSDLESCIESKLPLKNNVSPIWQRNKVSYFVSCGAGLKLFLINICMKHAKEKNFYIVWLLFNFDLYEKRKYIAKRSLIQHLVQNSKFVEYNNNWQPFEFFRIKKEISHSMEALRNFFLFLFFAIRIYILFL